MRFASIYLQNYIGIYNGMGLNEIFIDFTTGTHRTIIIRGDNGSGKSTIMKSLSVFPDSNDQFIPEVPAKKEIVLIDGPAVYTLTFIHGVKSNGQREVTKAYISRNVNGVIEQLNENGNVSSYKDILYNEFSLDPNFESLSQLSTEDRGIADKKPADRKRFVNAILNNLEVYNDIYKTLTKRCSSYKNLISSITAKLGSIGDPSVIASNVGGIEAKINAIQDKKDQAIEGLANAKAKMDMLDPDGKIQSMIEHIEIEGEAYKKALAQSSSIIMSARLGAGISLTDDIETLISDTKAKIDNLNVDNQIKRGQIESFLREKENEAADLSAKVQKLQSFEQEWRFEQICDMIVENEAAKKEIADQLAVTGIQDILSVSKESYIAALNAINRIADRISDIKDQCNFNIFSSVVNEYLKTGKVPDPVSTNGTQNIITGIKASIKEYEAAVVKYSSDVALVEKCVRPKECTIDSCPYIAEAIAISKQDPKRLLEEVSEKLKEANIDLETYENALANGLEYNACITQFNNLLRDIESNSTITRKIPGFDIFSDKRKLISDILRGDTIDTLHSIYQYINLANLFDEYSAIDRSLRDLYAEQQVYQSKQDAIDEIQRDIDRINSRLSDIEAQIIPVQSALAMNDKALITLQKNLGIYQSIAEEEKKSREISGYIEENEKLYKENKEKITQFNAASRSAIKQTERIEEINKELTPLMHERDRLNHQMRLVDDYNRELYELNNQYNILETIRYYSSPTTGIQLVFMEMYMGKIIQVANDLLSMFFNGQFRIMPFIINETEFRIPCAGDGIINDDISSMSSAQIAMISMILSFSFLYSSNSRYNILKLDEIDGPLDSNNRIMFVDVLNSVMNMMGTEQCIMISHNTELQVEDADIILLKSSENNDYMHGNIIWKY